MKKEEHNVQVILEPYLSKITNLYDQMHFSFFENNKPYSFDYSFKSKFYPIAEKIRQESLDKSQIISPTLSNKFPIFLPNDTRRISFFTSQAKSVRSIEIDKLEDMFSRQALKQVRAGKISYSEIKKVIQDDLDAFNTYHKAHDFTQYRRDIFSKSIQFNAYDDEDKLLVENSFVKGGLVFDMKKAVFKKEVFITYPRHRKQRSDKKETYLPLQLMKIRGILTSTKDTH